MSAERRVAAVAVLAAFLSVACLSLEPPRSELAALRPTATVTPTIIPSPTEPPRTPTPTSTTTPTFTPSPTITPTPANDFSSIFGNPGSSGQPPVTIAPPAQGPSSGLPTGFPGPAGSGPLPVPASGTAGGGNPGAPAPIEVVVWDCNGDERMDFVPPEAVIGDVVTITVSSSGRHGYIQLQGPLPFDKVGEGRGGPGYYWQWKKNIEKAGKYIFEFYAGPRKEYRCVTGEFQATTALAPTATATPRLLPTPTPSSTPRPDH